RHRHDLHIDPAQPVDPRHHHVEAGPAGLFQHPPEAEDDPALELPDDAGAGPGPATGGGEYRDHGRGQNHDDLSSSIVDPPADRSSPDRAEAPSRVPEWLCRLLEITQSALEKSARVGVNILRPAR